MKKLLFVIYFCLSISCVFAQLRTFDQIFPSLDSETRAKAFSEEGFFDYYRRNLTLERFEGGSSSKIPLEIINNVLSKKLGYYTETINVYPCNSSNITILDIYNALANIRSIKGITYESHSKGAPVPLFEDATRIISQTNTSAVTDPAPKASLPNSETFYVKLKDTNFGNTYYKGEILPIGNGLSFSLTNFKSITYFLVTVIKAEKFTAQLYIEPIREGILIYSVAGVDMSDFASNRISVNSAIPKRLGVITNWASGEILKKVNK